MAIHYKPIARVNDLVIQKLKDECLVYDLKINKAYCLNGTSAHIFQLCNGGNSVTEISKKLSTKLGKSVSEDIVWLAVNQFGQDNLLDNPYEFEGMSRREIIKRVGFTSALALPIISSVSAPTAIHAQSVCGCADNFPTTTCAASGAILTFGCFPDQPACVAAAVAASSATTGCCNGVNSTNFDTPTPGCCTVNCEP